MASPGQPIEFQPTKRPHLMTTAFVGTPLASPQRMALAARAAASSAITLAQANGHEDGDSNPETPNQGQGQGPGLAPHVQSSTLSQPLAQPLSQPGLPTISTPSEIRSLFEGVFSSIEVNTQAMHQSVEHWKSATLGELHWILNSLEAAGSLTGANSGQNTSQDPSQPGGGQPAHGPGEGQQPNQALMLEVSSAQSHDAARKCQIRGAARLGTPEE